MSLGMDQEWGPPGKVVSPASHPALGGLGRKLNPNMAQHKPQKCWDCPKPPGEFGEGAHGGVQAEPRAQHCSSPTCPSSILAPPTGCDGVGKMGRPMVGIGPRESRRRRRRKRSRTRYLKIQAPHCDFFLGGVPGVGIFGVHFGKGTALSGFPLPVVASQLPLTP